MLLVSSDRSLPVIHELSIGAEVACGLALTLDRQGLLLVGQMAIIVLTVSARAAAHAII